MKHIVAIVQARMGSTRLPGKVLKKIIGTPMLVHQIERILRSDLINTVVISTTMKPEDDQIIALCKERGWKFFRGEENDLLDRYYQTALHYDATMVVRLTADCPLIDPEIIDQVISVFIRADPPVDFVSNSLPIQTFPRGLDTEVMSIGALKKAWREDRNPEWREHVTPYIERNPSKFVIMGFTNPVNLSHMRWTVDTLEDLEFVRKIYKHFNSNKFSWKEVLDFLEKHPEYSEINRNVRQKTLK